MELTIEQALQQGVAAHKAGKFKELEEIRKVNEIANLDFIIQEEPKGLGHALLCAEEFVGDSPFAVLLGDTICTGQPNCTRGLVEIFNEKKLSSRAHFQTLF